MDGWMIMNLLLVHFILHIAALLAPSVFIILWNQMRNKTVQKNESQHTEQRNEKIKQSNKPNKTQKKTNYISYQTVDIFPLCNN